MDVAVKTGVSGSSEPSKSHQKLDVLSGDNEIKPIPKKRGRKPKITLMDGLKTFRVSTALTLARAGKKRVSVSANVEKASKQSEDKKPVKSRLATPGHPIWKSIPLSLSSSGSASSVAPNKNPRPRQWCSSKEELLAILPELGSRKLMDNCPVPVVLIEGIDGMSISDSRLSNDNRTVVNLCVERDFSCVISDLTQLSTPSEPDAMAPIYPDAASHSTLETLRPSQFVQHNLAPSIMSQPSQFTISKEKTEPNLDLTPDPTELTEIFPRISVKYPSLPIDNLSNPQTVQTSLKLEEGSLASALNLAGLKNSIGSHFPESLSMNEGKFRELKRSSKAPELNAQRKSKKDAKKTKLTSSGISPSRKNLPGFSMKNLTLVTRRRVSLALPQKSQSPNRPFTSVREKAAEEHSVRHLTSGRVLTPQRQLPQSEGPQTSADPIPSPPPLRSSPKPKLELKIKIPSIASARRMPRLDGSLSPFTPPPAIIEWSKIYDCPLSPLTPLDEDDSPVKSWTSLNDMHAQPVVNQTRRNGSPISSSLTDGNSRVLRWKDARTPDIQSVSGRDSTLSSSSPTLPVENNSSMGVKRDSPNVEIQLTISRREADNSQIPIPHNILPVEGWNDDLYKNTKKDVLKTLKFSKKDNNNSTGIRKNVKSTSTLPSTEAQMPKMSAVNSSQHIGINESKPLEPGEIHESNSMSSAQATTVVPTQPGWSYNQSLLMWENLQWMALTGDPNASHTSGPTRLERELHTPRSTAKHSSYETVFTPSSSSSSSNSLSASPFSIHTTSTPFTSPASGHSRLTSTTFSCPSPLIRTSSHLVPTAPGHSNSTTSPCPSVMNGTKLVPEGLNVSIRSSSPTLTSISTTPPLPPTLPAKKRRGRKRKVREIEEPVALLPAAKRIHVPEKEFVAPTFDTRVPIQDPPEIQVLVDAYIQDTPILAIASRDAMLAYCGASIGKDLSPEFQYMYMGFFRIHSVKEECVFRPSSSSAAGILVSSDYAFGRVQWRFGLEWICAGEEKLGVPTHLELSRPWWRDATDWRTPDVSVNQDVIMDSPTSFALVKSSASSVIPTDILDANDSINESSSRFLERRQEELRDPSQRNSLGLLCPSIVWLALLTSNSVNIGVGDIGSPRGWYCSSCGKLNLQRYFRRRKCDSTFCQDTSLTACDPHRLDIIRFVGQLSPLVFPLNTMPNYIDPLITEWNDGMRTVTYRVWNNVVLGCILDDAEDQIRLAERAFPSLVVPPLRQESVGFSSRAVKQEAIENMETEMELASDSTRESQIFQLAQTLGLPRLAQDMQEIARKRNIVAKHIFTCNNPKLQKEQTRLLDSIQESIILQRATMTMTPFFSYVAGAAPEGSFASEFLKMEVEAAPWKDVSPCIVQARDLLQHLGSAYGDMSHSSPINQLVVLGWTVTGKKQGKYCLHAKEKAVVIMALGHELGIKIVPRSGFPANAIRTKKIKMAEDGTGEDTTQLPVVIEDNSDSSSIFSPSAIANLQSYHDTTTHPQFMDIDPNAFIHVMDQQSGPTSGLRENVIMTEAPSEPFMPVVQSVCNPLDNTQLSERVTVRNGEVSQVTPAEGSEMMLSMPSEADFTGLIRMLSPESIATYEEDVPNHDEDDSSCKKTIWLGGVVDDSNEIAGPSLKHGNVEAKEKESLKEDMHFTLVHGDALVLSGDDFDYTIERKGMGLVLVGSNVRQ
ncbi:hypothetical protein J3R30DRAFT_3560634 [Lentinula aciculospora]|uniref:Uncharacterized protein n=1 Tax=Lentinula aciculospora TaxID=153920 RepID=A0A9W8ZWG4_9AGAR|nr:hypothetical protein J3R30DRAFT_3560634 [Lentinula aciculospora]